MKPRKRWLGLVAAPFALALLAFAQPALANTFNGTCAQYPGNYDGNGDVNINNTGACTLPAVTSNTGSVHITSSGAITSQAISAAGEITIYSASGNVGTQALTSGNSSNVEVIADGGNISTGVVSASGNMRAIAQSGTILISGNLTSNVGGNGGNIILQAGGTVRAGAISTNGGAKTGGVQIDAQMNGGNTLFRIGNNATNGVTSINTSNVSGGGNAVNFVSGGLQITNGNSNSTGGITVTAMSAINVVSSASRSGIINLNAQNGTLTLPGGTLNASGPAGQGAGYIALLAKTITTANGTIIKASQTTAAGSTNHGVVISAETVNVAGASGLQVLADGNGLAGNIGYVSLLPKGAATLTSNNDFSNILWTLNTTNQLSTNAGLTVAGAGAPLTVSANGNNTQVTVSGYPINFNNGPVTLRAKGGSADTHRILIQYTGAFNNTNGLTFGGNGAVTLDTSGTSNGDSAGNIYVLVDQMSIASTVPSFTVSANGLAAGTGALVQIQPTKVVTVASPAVSISANGAGGNITFAPWTGTASGDVAITSATFDLNANARASGNGNAGTIYFAATNTNIGASSKLKFSSVGPTSGTGNGGNITVFPGALTGGTLKLGTNNGNLQVLANAGSTGGDGGTVNVNPYPAPNGNISIETANAVSAAASTGASANSKGGSVTLIGNPNVTVPATLTGASINVDGKGNKDGGTIKILGNGTLNLGTNAGGLSLSAKASGTGKGGNIEVGYTTTLTQDGEISVAGGSGSGSNGQGGAINLHDLGTATISGKLTADGAGTGKAGTISVNSNAFNTMNLNNSTFSASGDLNGSGAGNTITIANQGTITVDQAIFKANGGGTGGNAGSISMNINTGSQAVVLTKAKFEARGNLPASSNGLGGIVQINKATGTFTDTDPNVGINVPYVINVDGGVGLGTTDFDGSIALNGVTCQQYKTVAAIFPKVGWDCITPGSGSYIPTLVSAGASLSTTIQNQFANLISPPPAAPRVGVYAFNSLLAQQQFFGRPQTGPYDSQFGISAVSWLRVSSTFLSSSNGNNAAISGSPTIMVGALVHELGHHADYIWGPGLQNLSAQSGWTSLIAPEFAAMDTKPCVTVFNSATCTANPGKTNSQIFDIRFPGIGHAPGELFAAMFEHVNSFLTGNPPSYQVEPELEKALDTMTSLKSSMSNLIASPPPATK
ncbi:MAG: hypothetical protein K2Y32_11510 [Candidatus Obscuribacterales bacterium]|nr:hypothetical protein [Candidatus Obscuribacterales bacterium]